jgi:hypothetical protein
MRSQTDSISALVAYRFIETITVKPYLSKQLQTNKKPTLSSGLVDRT